MKREPMPEFDPEDDNEIPAGATQCDWKANPEDVLTEVDQQLAGLGFEIVLYEADGDYYAWKIVPKAP